jgi:hypothetical protein
LSKVSEEIENHIGIPDETLAEFVIAMAKGKTCPAELKKALEKEGAELSDEFVETLFHLIYRLQYPEQTKIKMQKQLLQACNVQPSDGENRKIVKPYLESIKRNIICI